MLTRIVLVVSLLLPLVMLLLERKDVLSRQQYLDKWRNAVLVIAVLSMAFTPADPGSMLILFVPLVLLYCAGIGLCYVWPGRTDGRDS